MDNKKISFQKEYIDLIHEFGFNKESLKKIIRDVDCKYPSISSTLKGEIIEADLFKYFKMNPSILLTTLESVLLEMENISSDL